MYRNILVGGLTAATILGAGGTALALTGSSGSTTNGSGQTATAASLDSIAPAHGRARLLKRLSHAQITTQGKNGFVTHDLIKGTVTAVSSTSITVRAADKTSETFAVTKDTKVRMRSGAGKGTASSIGSVATGDQVLVAGTGTSTYTAKHIVDIKK